ncbi:MAG: radical SAM protein [bacterium]|nr:radical SAM protein [bacterium]
MIGITKLLTGVADLSDKIKQGTANTLAFSNISSPIIVWNVTNKCNLNCIHCYIKAENKEYQDELTTQEAKNLINNLAEINTPVLLFSGGEPLLREDIFELGLYAKNKGIRIVISSNGTLINNKMTEKIKDIGFQYVGVSIDGVKDTHNKFRGLNDGFQRAIKGIRSLKNANIKTGIRFTVNKNNYKELPEVIDIALKEGIDRFCMYHLVYSGRGRELLNRDISNEQREECVNFLINKALELEKTNSKIEILTTDNHVDGIQIYNFVKKNKSRCLDEVMLLLKMHGGCSAGKKIANIDSFGNVHPCQFWPEVSLGNIKQQKFSQIWNNKNCSLLNMLRDKEKHLKGKCQDCDYNNICGGCRIRAYVKYGDYWAEDPACYYKN